MHRRDLLKLGAFAIPSAWAQQASETAMLSAMDTGFGLGRDFFQLAKSVTSNLYYNTQIGYQELNKGGRVPASIGCSHQSHA
ncbi:MAG TPA: hypothetical protein VMT15_08385 [Bryobacteraceae bacterium]|nr:hypothetical protein [Bryobacteraceae bacterium]